MVLCPQQFYGLKEAVHLAGQFVCRSRRIVEVNVFIYLKKLLYPGQCCSGIQSLSQLHWVKDVRILQGWDASPLQGTTHTCIRSVTQFRTASSPIGMFLDKGRILENHYSDKP